MAAVMSSLASPPWPSPPLTTDSPGKQRSTGETSPLNSLNSSPNESTIKSRSFVQGGEVPVTKILGSVLSSLGRRRKHHDSPFLSSSSHIYEQLCFKMGQFGSGDRESDRAGNLGAVGGGRAAARVTYARARVIPPAVEAVRFVTRSQWPIKNRKFKLKDHIMYPMVTYGSIRSRPARLGPTQPDRPIIAPQSGPVSLNTNPEVSGAFKSPPQLTVYQPPRLLPLPSPSKAELPRRSGKLFCCFCSLP